MGRNKPNKPRRNRPGHLSDQDTEHLAVDLLTRTETAVEQICRTAVDTGITFTVTDIVDAVERALPAGYPTGEDWEGGRRNMIERMAQDLLSGEAYAGTAPH